MNVTYFSHGRTALKYGIRDLFDHKDEILVPELICDSAIHPFQQLKINYRFYKVSNNLKIKWDYLTKIINNKTKAILFINYFGIPNEINKILEFAKKNKLLTIEDNAHGFMGKYQNKLLGTFGDIGISSPRKHINIYSGGVLYSKMKINLNLMEYLPKYQKKKFQKIKFYIKKFPKLKNSLNKIINTRPIYEDQNYFREEYIEDYLIDSNSLNLINSYNYEELLNRNIINFQKWEKFSYDNNLNIIFKDYPKEINPWCFPVYVENHKEQIAWFKWAWKHNVQLFSWPTLPLELLNKKTNAYKIWSSMICFSTKEFF